MKPSFLITSGPTREYLDPVRYISNASSGRMGYELARAALAKGYKVVLIAGPVNIKYPKGAAIVAVRSAREMFEKTKKHLDRSDIVIGAAAVSDYRPKNIHKIKLKKNKNYFTLEMVKNPDIIEYIGKNKKNRVVVGFALETDDIIRHARKKLAEKKTDLIVANSEKAIDKIYSDFIIISSKGKASYFRSVSKKYIAKRIINESIRIWKNNRTCKVAD